MDLCAAAKCRLKITIRVRRKAWWPVSDWNNKIIEEFRQNEGRVGGPFQGAPLLLLTTTGAKSGQKRIAPLMYRQEGDDQIVFGSKQGAHTHPDWYYNLKADPSVSVEVGAEQFSARATEVTGEERDRIFAAQAEMFPQFTEYQDATKRIIPVIALRRA